MSGRHAEQIDAANRWTFNVFKWNEYIKRPTFVMCFGENSSRFKSPKFGTPYRKHHLSESTIVTLTLGFDRFFI